MPADTRERTANSWRRAGTAACLGLLLSAAGACKSAEEKCALAQGAAEQAWRGQLAALQQQADDARAAQASSQAKLVGEIEPRLTQAAAQEASARYDRNSDAWMRAYQASQNAGCDRDPECAQLRHTNTEAKDRQQELLPKLAAVRAVLAAIHGPAEPAKQAVEAIGPEFGNAALEAAKQLSGVAYTTCKDLKPKPAAPEAR